MTMMKLENVESEGADEKKRIWNKGKALGELKVKSILDLAKYFDLRP